MHLISIAKHGDVCAPFEWARQEISAIIDVFGLEAAAAAIFPELLHET